jgi:hypothetical protein
MKVYEQYQRTVYKPRQSILDLSQRVKIAKLFGADPLEIAFRKLLLLVRSLHDLNYRYRKLIPLMGKYPQRTQKK